MAQATSYATIFLLSLCFAILAVGQELEIEGSAAAPDVFDLEYEFEAVDAVYETPDDDYDDEQSEEPERVDEQPEDEQPEDEYEEPEEEEITNEPEEPEEDEEDEQAEKVVESDAESEDDDGELNVQITEEEFPGCSTFDQSAQALYLPEHVLWSVGLEDATACCEICGAYLECQMWTMDRSELLCTLLVTDGVETRQNPEWATGYKEL